MICYGSIVLDRGHVTIRELKEYEWQEVLTLDDELEGDGATQRAQGHLTLVEAGVRVRQVLEGGHFICLEEPVILERTCNHTQRT